MADDEKEPPKLTPKQQLFCDAYIGKARGNATEAAEQAGYKGNRHTLQVVGSENLLNPVLRAYIDARLHEATLSANEVLARLTEHANASIEPFMFQQGEVIGFDLYNEDAKPKLHLVKKCKTKVRRSLKPDSPWEETEVEFELHDAQNALIQLGRYHGLFTDRTELTGKNGEPLTITAVEAVRPPDTRSDGDNTAGET